MNILIVTIGSQFGYITEHYYYSRYLKTKNKVTLLCSDLGFSKIKMDGVDVIYLVPNKNIYISLFFFFRKVLKICILKNLDVVLISYFRFCFLLRFLLPFKKLILDIRTGSIGTDQRKVQRSNTILWFESLFFKNVLINTSSLAKELKIKKYKYLPIGAENVIHTSKNFNIIHLLYVGTLDNRKIEDTLNGLHLFMSRNGFKDHLKYDIVGFGSPEIVERINNKIIELDLAEVVSFHGRKTIEELPAYFSKANIGVGYVPIIKCYECQPVLKVLEYLMNGMPVIATKTYEMKKIVGETNGVLIDDNAEGFADGLFKIVQLKENYNSDSIKKTIEEYSWQKIIANNLEPYLKEACH